MRLSHVLLCFSFLFCSVVLFGQTSKTPVEILSDSMNKMQNINLNQAIKIGEKALQLAKQTNDTVMLAMISDNMSGIFLMMGKYGQAIDYIQDAMYWYRFCGNEVDILWCQYYLGIAHSLQGDYDIAINEYQHILKTIDSAESKRLYLFVLEELGSMYYYKGMYNNAIETYQQVRASVLPDIELFIIISINLGGVLNTVQLYDSAVVVLQEGIDYAEKSGLILRKASLLTNLSDAWKGLGRLNDAIKSIDEAILIREEANDSLGLSNSYRTKGGILIEKKEFDRANDYYFKSLKIDETLNIPDNIATTYCLIGECLQYKTEHEAAIAYFQESYKIAKDIGVGAAMETALRGQALSFMALNNTKEAMELMDEYVRVHDSIQRMDSNSGNDQPETKSAENILNPLIKFIFIILIVLLIILISVLLYKYARFKKIYKNNP